MMDINVFMDSIKDNEDANDILKKVSECFPEATENLQFKLWLKYVWGENLCGIKCVSPNERETLKNMLVSFYASIEKKEKQYVAYITVYISASRMPIQNKVKVIGTFSEIMDSISQLQRTVGRDINLPIKYFELTSTVASQLGEIYITLTLFI